MNLFNEIRLLKASYLQNKRKDLEKTNKYGRYA
jgi:hypothetical protein